MKTKVTVVGGAGFVGTNLCSSLASKNINFEIIDLKVSRRFPDNSKIGDVCDLQSLRETITGNVVVNLAAVHRDDADKVTYYRTNVDGAKCIAQICTEKSINKIVFISSVAVYGYAMPKTGEDGEINPFNEYGRTKFLAEERLREWVYGGHNSLVIVRPTVIFGEGNRGNVYNLIRQISLGRFIMIGSGNNTKSMAYIGNVVEFIEKCIFTEHIYALYNYVDSPDFDMNTLVKKINFLLKGQKFVGLRLPYMLGLFLGYLADAFAYFTGKNLPISLIRVKKFCATTSFNSNAKNMKNFKAPFTLEEGLTRTVKSDFIEPTDNCEIFYTE